MILRVLDEGRSKTVAAVLICAAKGLETVGYFRIYAACDENALAYLESHCAIHPAGSKGTSELSGPLSGLARPVITLAYCMVRWVKSRGGVKNVKTRREEGDRLRQSRPVFDVAKMSLVCTAQSNRCTLLKLGRLCVAEATSSSVFFGLRDPVIPK